MALGLAVVVACAPPKQRSAPEAAAAPPPPNSAREAEAEEEPPDELLEEVDAAEESAIGEADHAADDSAGASFDDGLELAPPEPAARGGGSAIPAPQSPPPPPESAPAPGAPPAQAPPPKAAPAPERPPAMRRETSTESRWPDRVVTVWFGTDRVTDSAWPGGFGDRPADRLALGTVEVAIPESHVRGQLERPSLFRLEFSEDPERHIVLGAVRELDEQAFVASIQASSTDTALIFVHGFWNSFQDGALRAGQLAWDLGYPGTPVLYSWASAGTATGYLSDAEAVVEAEPHFDAFVDLLVEDAGVREVHVVAHSMGTRLVAETLARRGQAGRAGVSELVLAAPDIDVRRFEDALAEPIGLATRRLTVYGSSGDAALSLSAEINAIVRLGDVASGALSMHGLEGIDATPVESSLDGHSYIAHNPSVLADLACLLRHVPVVDRPWLAAAGESWTFSGEATGEPCPVASP